MDPSFWVTWQPLIVALVPVVVAIVLQLIASIRNTLAKTTSTNLEIDQKQRDFMNDLFERAIDFAVFKNKDTTMTDALVQFAVRYVQDKGPDAVAYFKLNADKIAEIIASRMQARPDVNTGVESAPHGVPTLTLPELEVKQEVVRPSV